jgi:hypothetical protein
MVGGLEILFWGLWKSFKNKFLIASQNVWPHFAGNIQP